MAATSSDLRGNPIHVTSGWTEALLSRGPFKIQRVYWQQPGSLGTSGVVITQGTTGGMTYLNMKCEQSGISQVINLGDVWWNDPFIKCMQDGDLWIYLDN